MNEQTGCVLISIPKLSELSHLPISTLRAMERESKLPSIKIGKRTYVNIELFFKMIGNLDKKEGSENEE